MPAQLRHKTISWCGGVGNPYARAVIVSAGDRVSQAAGDRRRRQLWGEGIDLFRLAQGGVLPVPVAETNLLRIGRNVGLPESVIHQTMTSARRRADLEGPRRPADRQDYLRDRYDAQERILLTWQQANTSGRLSPVELRALLGFVSIGLRAGKARLYVSCRQLAEETGLSRSTVHRVTVKRLQGWIRCVDRGSARTGQPALWQFTPRTGESAHARDRPEVSLCRQMPDCPNLRALEKPVPHAGSLAAPNSGAWGRGSTKWLIYVELLSSDQPLRTVDIADRVRVSPGHVRRILAQLRDSSLVVTTDHLHEAVPPTQAQKDELCTDSELRRRKRHEQERVVYQRFLNNREDRKAAHHQAAQVVDRKDSAADELQTATVAPVHATFRGRPGSGAGGSSSWVAGDSLSPAPEPASSCMPTPRSAVSTSPPPPPPYGRRPPRS